MVRSGVSPSAEAESPNCTSRSTRATEASTVRARATARLAATIVLPDPPFGERTTITRPVGGASGMAGAGADACWRARAVRSTARRMASSSSRSIRAGSMTSRTPARRAWRHTASSGEATRMTFISGWSRSTIAATSRATSSGTSAPAQTTLVPTALSWSTICSASRRSSPSLPSLDVQTVVGADRSGGLLGEEAIPAEHGHRRRIRLRRGLEAWGIPRLDGQGLVRHGCTSVVA